MSNPTITRMSSQRLISLDVLRGLTVMLMIFVNNGAGEQIFAQLQHSRWNGMTLCDLVFPFFLFIMGVSTYLSLRKTQFVWSARLGRKIARRTLLLFVIGLAINWFDMACSGRPFDLSHLRIMGVMQRIALCYGATALIAVGCQRWLHGFRAMPAIIAALLAAYGALLLMGQGYAYDAAINLLSRVDQAVLGHAHLYHKSPVDPEGLVSTLAAVAHTLAGFYVAHWALGPGRDGAGPAARRSMMRFAAAGTVLAVVGLALSPLLPLNKRVWSPSYVCLSCGLAALLQALLILLVDLWRRPAPHAATTPTGTLRPRQGTAVSLTLIFGTNPLFLYVASEAIAIVLGATGIKAAAYDGIHAIVANGYWASAAYAALFVAVHALMGYPLWRRHIYIKL